MARGRNDWPKDEFRNNNFGGVQLSGIYTGQSGVPITPFLSVDSSGTGELNDRPNLVGDPNSGPRRPNEWFNRAAFAQPDPGTFGNSGRNVIIGPDLHSVDLAVNKLTKVAERASLQFRAEVSMSSIARISAFQTSISTAPHSVQSVKLRMLLPEIHGSAKAVLASFNLV